MAEQKDKRVDPDTKHIDQMNWDEVLTQIDQTVIEIGDLAKGLPGGEEHISNNNLDYSTYVYEIGGTTVSVVRVNSRGEKKIKNHTFSAARAEVLIKWGDTSLSLFEGLVDKQEVIFRTLKDGEKSYDLVRTAPDLEYWKVVRLDGNRAILQKLQEIAVFFRNAGLETDIPNAGTDPVTKPDDLLPQPGGPDELVAEVNLPEPGAGGKSVTTSRREKVMQRK